ncbi:MAG: HD domain-containing protein [Bacteroidetes bacterium]|nr:HD domain-containing protein [Bacteroidota bacterium]
MNCKKEIEDNLILIEIGKIADSINLECYVIGGYVRDLFLGIKSKDIDIVCIGSGIGLAKEVSKQLRGHSEITIYKNFGTAQIKYDNWEIEFVGARKESYNRNSRNPIVENGTLEDDQNRRDFTINALAIALNKNNFGNLLDPFDGLNDLKEKVIKTPLAPDQTFSDDPLRILRAIRFATRLGFNIEKDVFNSICNNIERLKIVSKERIIKEINFTILTKQPSRGFLLYLKSGILEIFLPELYNLQGREIRDGHSHKDNFFHTLQVLDNVAEVSDNLWLRWAAILHDIAKPKTKKFDQNIGFSFHGHEELGAKMIPKIFRRLKLPLGKEMEYVKKLVRLHLRPIALVNDVVTDSALRRLLYEAGDDINDLMLLCKADVTSKNMELAKRYLNNLENVETKLKEVEARDHIRNMKLVITGEIIMNTFNLKPSKTVGDIKDKIKEAILDGIINNEYDQAFNYMLKIGKEIIG